MIPFQFLLPDSHLIQHGLFTLWEKWIFSAQIVVHCIGWQRDWPNPQIPDHALACAVFRGRSNSHLFITLLQVDESVNCGNGPYVFKIQGRLSHLAGSLLPQEGESPVYSQLYIYDPAEALDHRMRHEVNRGLDRQVMVELQD